MKKLFILAAAITVMASCADEKFLGEDPGTQPENATDGAIAFGLKVPAATRAGELVGATAAEKLGGMFVVEGTKGSEATDAPSSTVVFDNYLVGYEYNHAGKTESDTHNWEYVGKESGITSSTIGSATASDRMTAATWSALHGEGTAQAQTIKYWDYSTSQYDFIAWSTGTCEAIATGDAASGKVKVTRINTGNTLASNGFTMTAVNANDLMQCYFTDINTVLKANYGSPVTLTFKNMAAKVCVALYETVPGYSVKDVKFYSSDANPTAPEDLGTGSSADNAILFTMGDDKLPQSGSVLVYYPHIGTTHRDAPQTKDYNKASVTVTPGDAKASTQTYGALTEQYTGKESHEAAGNIYLGRTLPTATYAGSKANNYYTAVIPNTNGKPLTLRVDYTLVSTDGSTEEIKVYGAKAVVPATYTNWQPNYAYTYVFKISDNSNGWTSQTATDPKGLFPITFDAVVASFVDVNAEQTTVTTVATPSITTYQQGHDHANYDEYSKSQKAGADQTNVKDLYVQVMDNSGATPSLKTDLNTTGKSLLFAVSKANASEAEVMDALQNRTNAPTGTPTAASYNDANPVGRNGITLTSNANIANDVTSIINGVDDQPITQIAGEDIAAGQVAKIDIDKLSAGTYAYVYCTPPTSEEKVYNVVSISTDEDAAKYYEIAPSSLAAASASTAEAGKVYFVENLDAKGNSLSPKSYTFVQTKVGVSSVTGLFEATISSKGFTYTSGNFYFDVYYQNNGAYAVKVIKVVN